MSRVTTKAPKIKPAENPEGQCCFLWLRVVRVAVGAALHGSKNQKKPSSLSPERKSHPSRGFSARKSLPGRIQSHQLGCGNAKSSQLRVLAKLQKSWDSANPGGGREETTPNHPQGKKDPQPPPAAPKSWENEAVPVRQRDLGLEGGRSPGCEVRDLPAQGKSRPSDKFQLRNAAQEGEPAPRHSPGLAPLSLGRAGDAGGTRRIWDAGPCLDPPRISTFSLDFCLFPPLLRPLLSSRDFPGFGEQRGE
ncbi:PREDICTED: uncharacterized protein LOC108445945 isoform X2 [Corvus brachyrhynchos]|uniref:uncharacterized protein LOC108445945 isoform X2 n=1 Tax=Corvus brachyrhynchos TaxID=85066 RepID=UPI0008167754|nr:PREDICTED: uncharacterized protein LOC108445945 isoform X2 [Corvus brachyrhynchos]